MRPRFASTSLPPNEQRAQGKPDARCTRGLACNVHKEVRTRAYRFSGEHPAFPAQWFYGLWRALLGEPGSFATIAREKPASHELGASVGRRDHTLLPYASATLVSRSIHVHRI